MLLWQILQGTLTHGRCSLLCQYCRNTGRKRGAVLVRGALNCARNSLGKGGALPSTRLAAKFTAFGKRASCFRSSIMSENTRAWGQLARNEKDKLWRRAAAAHQSTPRTLQVPSKCGSTVCRTCGAARCQVGHSKSPGSPVVHAVVGGQHRHGLGQAVGQAARHLYFSVSADKLCGKAPLQQVPRARPPPRAANQPLVPACRWRRPLRYPGPLQGKLWGASR